MSWPQRLLLFSHRKIIRYLLWYFISSFWKTWFISCNLTYKMCYDYLPLLNYIQVKQIMKVVCEGMQSMNIYDEVLEMEQEIPFLLGISIISMLCPWHYINFTLYRGPTWSYCSWIYNYLCNQCLSPLTLWVRISLRQHYVIKFVSDLRQVGGFHRVLLFPPPIK